MKRQGTMRLFHLQGGTLCLKSATTEATMNEGKGGSEDRFLWSLLIMLFFIINSIGLTYHHLDTENVVRKGNANLCTSEVIFFTSKLWR